MRYNELDSILTPPQQVFAVSKRADETTPPIFETIMVAHSLMVAIESWATHSKDISFELSNDDPTDIYMRVLDAGKWVGKIQAFAVITHAESIL